MLIMELRISLKIPHSNIVSYSSEGLTAVKPHGVFGSEKGLEKSKVLAVGLQVKLGFRFIKKLQLKR